MYKQLVKAFLNARLLAVSSVCDANTAQYLRLHSLIKGREKSRSVARTEISKKINELMKDIQKYRFSIVVCVRVLYICLNAGLFSS